MVALDPELKSHIVKNGNMTFIKHPLLVTVYMNSEMENEIYNRMFQNKKRRLSKFLEEKNYEVYLYMHERAFRFEALLKILPSLENEDLFDLVEYVWIDSENPYVNIKEWKLLFYMCENLGLFEDSKKDLPETFTIYRGTKKGIVDEGISWTTDREVAKKFSERFLKPGEEPLIKEKVVSKKDIFFYTDGRNEKEVIIK